jgi:hypothetical protein
MSVPTNRSANRSAECDSSLVSPILLGESDRLLAPIALFVYNRPEHTQRTVEALRANELAQESDLFVFADGAKNSSGADAVGAVREYIRSIHGFRSVTITEREQNLGLSKSVISGVTQLCNQYGRAIVVEDDIMAAPDFLVFLNRGLQRYANEPNMFSVCAFNVPIVPPKNYSFDAFCSYRFMCWGWATWKDRWDRADWSVNDFREFMADGEQQRRFNQGGNDLSWSLARHMQGKIDSWDTIWAYTHSKHDAFALLPVVSRTYNIGFDGTGIHCRRAPFKQNALPSEGNSKYRFPDSVIPESYFAKEIRLFHQRSIPKRFARYILDKIEKR